MILAVFFSEIEQEYPAFRIIANALTCGGDELLRKTTETSAGNISRRKAVSIGKSNLKTEVSMQMTVEHMFELWYDSYGIRTEKPCFKGTP